MILKKKSGFTLLEVLVALVIIGVSFGAIFQAFSQSKRTAWKSEEKMECARIAQNIFANSSLMENALKHQGEEGVLKGEQGWRYAISVNPLEIEIQQDETLVEVPNMLRVTLNLTHNAGQKEKTFRLTRWYRH